MFQIGSRVFLVVANGHRFQGNGPSQYTINSTIYELDMSGRMFVRFQDIVTYRYSCEFHRFYLRDSCTNTDFLIIFVVEDICSHLNLSSLYLMIFILSSAVDWEFFSLGEEYFLVVANSYNGESYSLNSILYRYSTCQHVPTLCDVFRQPLLPWGICHKIILERNTCTCIMQNTTIFDMYNALKRNF